MNEEIELAMNNLMSALVKVSHKNNVAVEIFINYEGFEITERFRTKASLDKDGISMKNLRGEYIRDLK